MSFLQMSPLQALLVVLLTAAVVTTLFFLKLRSRRVVVASSLLWRRVLDQPESSSLLEKLRRWLSLLLALAIALLTALAVARPYPEARGNPLRPVLLVLDSSPAMETLTATGATRWERAVAHAREIVAAQASDRPLALADTAGRVRLPPTADRGALDAALERMRPFPGRQAFPAGFAADAETILITDGVAPLAVPEGAETISVFEAAANVAITAFDIRVDPAAGSGYSAYLEVVNYSPDARDVNIQLSGAGGERLGEDVRLAAGATWSAELDLREFAGGGVRARVQAAGDALPLDDTAFSYLPARRGARVRLVTDRRGGPLETLLGLSPRVDLDVVAPRNFAEDPAVDLYVFERFAPPQEPPRPSLVFAAEAPWLPAPRGLVTAPTIRSWDAEHPIMRFVPVYDVAIDQTRAFDPGAWTVAVASGETPLIAWRQAPRRSIFVGFDLAQSDFAFHLGFPILIENALAWFSGDALAERRGLGAIELPANVETVTRLDGREAPAERRFGAAMIEATEPELFTAVAEGRRVRVAANLTDRRFSNVNATTAPPGAAPPDAAGGVELWPYMLLAALLLATLEWWTYHRRITL